MSICTAVTTGGAEAQPAARAVDVQTHEVYHAAVRPGYTCWVALWHDTPKDRAVYLSFLEMRRAPHPNWEPVPLDFWESMGLPHGYHTAYGNADPSLVCEFVVLKSVDDGGTWRESGRSLLTDVSVTCSLAGLPDGRIIRSVSNHYHAWQTGGAQKAWVETSADGGSTWQWVSDLGEGHMSSGHQRRMRRLRDGTLVQLWPHTPSFGPGQERVNRHTRRAYVRNELTAFVFTSQDDGQTWSGPLTAFPGVNSVYEPDFVELASGDLLFLNSTVQDGPQVRQYFRKTERGFVPGPVYDVVSGRVPECLVYTKSGLIVGAVRGGEYTVSNDEGATWHRIEGLPACGYQPYITELSDGRIMSAWHGGGGDEPFGVHMWVGTHTFRLEVNLPQRTELGLRRDLDEAGERYANRYTVTLTAGDLPLPDQTVNFSVHPRAGRPQSPPAQAGTVVTDARGQATVDLTEMFAGVDDVHLGYTVNAWFAPEAESNLSPARADSYYGYVITTSREDLGW